MRDHKKPVELDAIRWTGENPDEVEAWSDGEVRCEGSVAVVRILHEIFVATDEPAERM